MNPETNSAADRALSDQDQPSTQNRIFLSPPEPLNRRGRRNLAAEVRRADRRAMRSLRHQEIEDR